MSNTSPHLLINTNQNHHGKLGHITLNRPAVLNALSLDMLKGLKHAITTFDQDASVDAIVIKGAGDRAFCAGGDVRAVCEHREAILKRQEPHFELEYFLNDYIFHMETPLISLLDGITMGGGVGLSIWGSHPIATERLCLAMPETSIGLFPDIGSSYFLTRLPHRIGYFLGLTGMALNAFEAYKLGLVKTVIAHQSLHRWLETLNPAHIDLPQPISLDETSALFKHQAEIEACFSKSTIMEIINELEKYDSWCQSIAQHLRTRSPLSLVITLEYLKRSEGQSFDTVMALNHQLIHHFLNDPEFTEGVRAMLIDKDKQPKWHYSLNNIEQIPVTDFFET